MRLLKISNFLIVINILLISLISFTKGLYEDQIGKFDWSKHYIGKVIDGYLDDRNGQFFAYTEENVLAALNVETGSIIWRQVFEKDERGKIHLLAAIIDESTDQSSTEVRRRIDDNSILFTVNGYYGLIFGRGWNLKTGNLAFEWTISQNNQHLYWFFDQSTLYSVSPTWGSRLEVTGYNVKTGSQELTKEIAIAGIQKKDCEFFKSVLICQVGNQVLLTNLKTGGRDSVTSSKKYQTIRGTEPVLLVDGKIYNIKTRETFNTPIQGEILSYIKKSNRKILLQATVDKTKQSINVKATNIEDGELLSTFDVDYPEHLGEPVIIDASCKKSKKFDVLCRAILTTENSAVVQVQSGPKTWIREESLADIAAVEMLDLPLLDNEGAIEKQLKSRNGDILESFLQRMSTQLNHVKHLLWTLFDVVSTKHRTETGEFTRDAFGLHTLIVILTTSGKLFGIDNITGKQHYVTYLPNFTGFENGEPMKLIVQRTSKHFPHPAQCSVAGRHKITGNGLVHQFNPITGESINNNVIELGYSLQQLTVLQPSGEFLKEILFLDKNNRPHVLPGGSLETAHNTYIYTADKETSVVVGYFIELKDQQLEAIEIWRINLSGSDNTQKILTIASKNPIEHVHSQGRVLNDRSVLYKYTNPNLVAVVTQGLDNIYKYVLNVHLIDVVSGGIVSTITHRRVRGPVNMVHSENWLVYTYYNDKVRRTELTAVELYEGNTQANSTVWTSFDAPPLPAVVQQSYIIPSNVHYLKETITEKGITHKHILIALSSGGILEMPWQLLDPRRPILGTDQVREEGAIPYIPELPLSSESIINYNQTISRFKGIYTAPSGLESTCLIFAHGLDFFVTRVAPSKTYDLLKDDFDYFLISSVLLGLMVASFVVKFMSAKKLLKQAWK